jgi:hypothetical protein
VNIHLFKVDVLREKLRVEKEAAVAEAFAELAASSNSSGSATEKEQEELSSMREKVESLETALGEAATKAAAAERREGPGGTAASARVVKVPLHIWLGSSVAFGVAVAFVLLVIASRRLRMEPFVPNPVF